MHLGPEARRARARLAALRRHRGPGALTDADVRAAERQLAEAKDAQLLEHNIAAVVAAAPQMTPEQRARLRPIFATSAASREGGAAG